jgi:hypothetical protein
MYQSELYEKLLTTKLCKKELWRTDFGKLAFKKKTKNNMKHI